MSFKLVLDVGFFDPAACDVVRRLDIAFVQQVMVQAGGRRQEDGHPEDAQRNRIAPLYAARGRPILGYLGTEYVVLQGSGFITLALSGSNPAALAFLRMMVAEGCKIWTEDGEATQSVLDNLTATEARWAALKKA